MRSDDVETGFDREWIFAESGKGMKIHHLFCSVVDWDRYAKTLLGKEP